MNRQEETAAPRKEKSRIRIWLEIAGAVAGILTAFAGASIWLFQNVSDKAVARAVLPMKLERLEQTSKDHETRLAEVERKAQASEIDRAQIHKDVAESRAAFTSQIRELSEQLQKRLDRLDDKADRIGERVGVVPR
ncbi:hypothetical protein ACXR0O_19255 [Verrucomicrobiota bacterium sgz303538]